MRLPILIPAVCHLALLLSACNGSGAGSGDIDTPGPAPSVAAARVPASAGLAVAPDYPSMLGDEVWQRVQASSWYDGGDFGSAGANVLEVLSDHGPLWRDSDSLALLDTYPDGIPDETLSTARTFARMTLRDLHAVILAPWLADGIDDYERAIMQAVSERPVSVAALRRTMEDGFFRPTFDTEPDLLTSVRINAVGSLSPYVLELLEQKRWFEDGIDAYEASLLGVINTLLSVDEQIRILDTEDYERLPLSTDDVAVVYFGDPERSARAQKVASAWMEKIEAFVGPFRPIGLVIDTTPIQGEDACHTADGGGTRPGRITLPADFCFQSPVVIHELTHAFLGGRYPTWFAEGVAEVTAYHLTGTRAGYNGGEGTIELNTRYVVLSRPYGNQAALGADFLQALYNLAGADEVSAFIKDVSGRSMSGDDLLGRIREMKVDVPRQLDDLIADSFGVTPASP